MPTGTVGRPNGLRRGCGRRRSAAKTLKTVQTQAVPPKSGVVPLFSFPVIAAVPGAAVSLAKDGALPTELAAREGVQNAQGDKGDPPRPIRGGPLGCGMVAAIKILKTTQVKIRVGWEQPRSARMGR
jgi:hypothetical protein